MSTDAQPRTSLGYYIPNDISLDAGLRDKTLPAREFERFWQSIQILSSAVVSHAADHRAYYFAAADAKDKQYWIDRGNESARCAARYRKRRNAHMLALAAAVIR